MTELLPLDVIRLNPDQPRKHFAQEALDELADSIRSVGVLEPIVVREMLVIEHCADHPGKRVACEGHERIRYLIVAGERRWRAAKIAGLEKIPAVVRSDLTDADAFMLSLIENTIRADMNPMEEAQGYQRLAERGLAIDEVARLSGKKVGSIRTRLGLLRLAEPIRDLVRTGQMDAYDAGHLTKLSPEGQYRVIAAMRSGVIVKSEDVARLAGAIYAQESQSELFAVGQVEVIPAAAQRARREVREEMVRALAALERAATLLSDLPHEAAEETALFAEEAGRRASRIAKEAHGRRVAQVARQLAIGGIA